VILETDVTLLLFLFFVREVYFVHLYWNNSGVSSNIIMGNVHFTRLSSLWPKFVKSCMSHATVSFLFAFPALAQYIVYITLNFLSTLWLYYFVIIYLVIINSNHGVNTYPCILEVHRML
jgi:hypothetical protein